MTSPLRLQQASSTIHSSGLTAAILHLVIAAAACVKLASHRAHDLCEASLIGGVDVFIPCLDLEAVRLPLTLHLFKAARYLVSLVLGYDASLGQGLGICLAALQHAWLAWPWQTFR